MKDARRDDSSQGKMSLFLAAPTPTMLKGDLIYKTRRRMGALWLWLIASWLVCISVNVIAFWTGIPLGLFVLLLPLCLWIGFVLICWSTRYDIYQHRIDFVTGLMSQRVTPLWVWQIKQVTFHCSWLDRLTGGATITIVAEMSGHGPGKVTEFQLINMHSCRPDWGSTRFMVEFYKELVAAASSGRRAMVNWFI